MSAFRKHMRRMKKKDLDFWGRPLPEFKSRFIVWFCPKCKKQRNMILWGAGADHETARCVHCGGEWVFTFEDGRRLLIGEMKKLTRKGTIVRLTPLHRKRGEKREET